MIIVMKKNAEDSMIKNVIEFIRSHGLQEHVSDGEEVTIIGAVGDERIFNSREIESLPGVEKTIKILHEWRIISREAQEKNSSIIVRGFHFGNHQPQMIHPFHDSYLTQKHALYLDPFYISPSLYSPIDDTSNKKAAITLKEQVNKAHLANLPTVVRIRDVRELEIILKWQADIIYLGGELLNNRTLLDEVGSLNTPVVICKDKHHSVEDWLIAAEYIALKGNHQLILGEAGTLNLDKSLPNRLDIEAIIKAKQLSHLPILVNLLNLSHTYMSETVLVALAKAANVDAIIATN